MKKTLAILALLSLATLPSLAGQKLLYLSGYRIGDSELHANDGRIVASNIYSAAATKSIPYSDAAGGSNVYFTATIPAGQQISRWLSYTQDPTLNRPGTITNVLAGAGVTSCTWTYKEADPSASWISIDYNYIDYTIQYNANGGSGSMSPTTQCYTNTFNLTGNAFAKTGYTFDVWTNKTGTAFANQATVSGSSFGVRKKD